MIGADHAWSRPTPEPLLILLRRFATESAREEARVFCDELAGQAVAVLVLQVATVVAVAVLVLNKLVTQQAVAAAVRILVPAVLRLPAEVPVGAQQAALKTAQLEPQTLVVVVAVTVQAEVVQVLAVPAS